MKVKRSKSKTLSRIIVSRSGRYLIPCQETLRRKELVSRIVGSKKTHNNSVADFLDFLDRDIEANPNNVQELPEDLFYRAAILTKDIEADLDEELPEDFMFL